MDSRILSAEHAQESGVAKPWEQSNEDWWDWYLSLADASEEEPTELIELSPPEPVAAPSANELRAELAEPYPLSDGARERFAAEGFVKLPGAVSPGALAAARAEVARLAATGDGPGRSGFRSMDLMWQERSEVLETFALSPWLGSLAAELLEVRFGEQQGARRVWDGALVLRR